MSGWVGDKDWKSLADSAKREWMKGFWENGLKKNFNGADQELGLTLPVEILVKQRLKFNIFSRDKTPRPRIRDNQLRLQRCENFLFLTFRF
jgi:hypothetical protein